jgi:acyl-homoserine-lactone acylase
MRPFADRLKSGAGGSPLDKFLPLTTMRMRLFFLLLLPAWSYGQLLSLHELSLCQQRASRVRIVQDNWGIPHIYGKTDADAVFGLMYVECEEDFPRVERNYLEVMGRLSEVDGPSRLYDDLEMQMIYDTADARADYAHSPEWLRNLLDAFADGVNYYLYTHPKQQPRVLTRFEPWFALLFTDGSISATQTGGITKQDIKNLYAVQGFPDIVLTRTSPAPDRAEQTGSNGFAVAPSRTLSAHALLYINPHVTFYFRTEVQLVSEEGLNAYGAVTWGQFFVYQGFNEHCGWMHTSSYADVADLYVEQTVQKGDSLFYVYDKTLRPVKSKQVLLRYGGSGSSTTLAVTTYYTHHGPVLGSRDGKWLSLRERNRSMSALEQSWLRTKASSFDAFKRIMDLRSNNSNNTVYADDQGNIAYWHGNFMPVRDRTIDWSKPVDGTTPATEWKGVHELDQGIHIYNPASGWIENCNSTPFTASGESSPSRKDYPTYMAPDGQNLRALNAIRVLSREHQFTLDKLIAAGYDHYLYAFEILLPSLAKAYHAPEQLSDSLSSVLQAPMRVLESWDRYSSENSVATTLAVEWAISLGAKFQAIWAEQKDNDQVNVFHRVAQETSPRDLLAALTVAVNSLQAKYGRWDVPWGDINRFQRRTGQITEIHYDSLPSLPVGMASGRWGSLPAFDCRSSANGMKQYGYSGNSFIAAVEFGKRVRARSVVTGGQSSDPSSPHFMDQAELFIRGQLKEVLFYPEDVMKHVERQYHPGE